MFMRTHWLYESCFVEPQTVLSRAEPMFGKASGLSYFCNVGRFWLPREYWFTLRRRNFCYNHKLLYFKIIGQILSFHYPCNLQHLPNWKFYDRMNYFSVIRKRLHVMLILGHPYNIHIYNSRFHPEGVAEISQIMLRDTHVLPNLVSYEEHCSRDRW
jgi:hypothetical protein